MPVLRSRDTSATPASSPEISIASPTPRRTTFFFPMTHNLSDTPESTPSCSPFLNEHEFLQLPPTPSESSSLSPSPAPRRRIRKTVDGHIKRPENAFILFRRDMCLKISAAKIDGAKREREADLSKTISLQWRALSEEERQVWKDMADEKKKEHQREYPDYKYCPGRSKKGNKKKARDVSEPDRDDEEDYRPKKGKKSTRRRPVSAPVVEDEGPHTAGPSENLSLFHPARPSSAHYPLYHELQFPDMEMRVTPSSCPASPRLVPDFDYDGYASDFHSAFYPDFLEVPSSTYGSTPSSSRRSSPFLGAYDMEYRNIDPQLRRAELDVDAHLHQDFLADWPEEGVRHSNDFDLAAVQSEYAMTFPCYNDPSEDGMCL